MDALTPALQDINCRPVRLAGPLPIHRATVDAAQWQTIAAAMAKHGARLVSLWGVDRRSAAAGYAACAAYACAEGLFWIDLPLDAAAPHYPDVAALFPAATRMQRAAYDLVGIVADGAADKRPWLRHGAWPEAWHPLRDDSAVQAAHVPALDHYDFVAVEGDGVHEIPVGPVHAGIIEPGHFRFSIVGEKVLRLEERLGYTHKGIEKRFVGMTLAEGAKLAGRVSGDTTVAYAWAYAMAAESAASCAVPERARWLRALLLERERIANHLGDLGALGNDAAFAFGLAQFSRLKEYWLRLSGDMFGHRFMMDRIVPGGVACDIDEDDIDDLVDQCATIEHEVRGLRAIYDEHSGLQDRFMTTGRATPALARQLGLTGLAGRASGIGNDLRADFVFAPYDQLDFKAAIDTDGDVAARVAVRFDEVFESLRLIRSLVDRLPEGPVLAELGAASGAAVGAGWVEGWRGEILVVLETGTDGRIRRCHCHDPSWQNWPVLEHAIMGNIVPDFPLINKSFNLSYSGQDL